VYDDIVVTPSGESLRGLLIAADIFKENHQYYECGPWEKQIQKSWAPDWNSEWYHIVANGVRWTIDLEGSQWDSAAYYLQGLIRRKIIHIPCIITFLFSIHQLLTSSHYS
jgi:hypothetical protein